MRGADLEARKAVERALEDQMRQGDRGFERVADCVGQQAAALQPAARLELPGAERLHENQDAELFGLGPDRVEFGVGQFLAGDAAADRQTAQAECLDRTFELLDSELRRQRRCCGPLWFRLAINYGPVILDQNN